MRMRVQFQTGLFFRVVLAVTLALTAVILPATAAGDTAVFYQGELKSGGQPVTGWYDFEFNLYDLPEGGKALAPTQRAAETYVQDGAFALLLDFGDVLQGQTGYIEVAVRPGGSDEPHTVLSPPQPVSAVSRSDVGALDGPGETWRLGITAEGGSGYDAVIGRPAAEVAAFRSDRGTSDVDFIFPAPAVEKVVQAARFYVIQRTGSYAGTAQMTLEVFALDGSERHTVSAAAVDLAGAATGTWTGITLSDDDPDDLVIGPGEHLAFHFELSVGPGGDLDVRPLFEVEVQ